MDKTKEFFSLNLETKLKYYIKGPHYDIPGYKPIGFDTFKSQSKQFNFSNDQLPEIFRDVLPEYILKARQLISYVHNIADMALELDDNTFEKNYANDNAIFMLRLAKYIPMKNEQQSALGEHQDYLGFTLIQNDDVPGI
ncbi:unnamed protein product [Rotaria sp. Silwood1]|nr:unnamed protein product [Rotaria sp. Silwood1]